MKTLTLAALVTLFSAGASFAGFKVPKNLHTPETLEAAKAEAAKEKKAVAFLYSDPGTT